MKLLIYLSLFFGTGCLPMSLIAQVKPQSAPISIAVKSDQKDTLKIEYAEHCFGNDIVVARKVFYVHQAAQGIPILLPSKDLFAYFSLKSPPPPGQTNEKNLFYNYLVEPGDQLTLTLNKDKIMFSGKGAAKNNCLMEIKNAEQEFERDYMASIQKQGKIRSTQIDSAYFSYYPEDLKQGSVTFFSGKYDAGIRILSSYKHRISAGIYNLIKADLLAKSENEMIRSLNFFYSTRNNEVSPAYLKQIKDQIVAIYEGHKTPNFEAIDKSMLMYSSGYLNYLINDIRRAPKRNANAYKYLKETYSGLLRDRLLALYFTHYYPYDPMATENIKNALKIVKTAYCREILLQVLNQTADGTKAYDFSLPNTKGEQVRLQDFKGKVVVIDFWYTGCPGCAGLAPHMKVISEQLKSDSSIAFVSVSVDRDKTEWINSVKSQKYTNEQSVDLYTNGLGKDHPIIRHYNIFGYPRILVIGKDGRIYNSSPKRPFDPSTEQEFINMLLAAKSK